MSESYRSGFLQQCADVFEAEPKQDVSLAKWSSSNLQSSKWPMQHQAKFSSVLVSRQMKDENRFRGGNSEPRSSYWHYKHRHQGNYPECSMSSKHKHKGLLIAPFCKWNMARSHSPMTPRATSLVSVSCHKCIIGFIINIIGQSACWLGYSLMSCVALANLWKEKLNVLHLDPPELLFVSARAGGSCDFLKVFREI